MVTKINNSWYQTLTISIEAFSLAFRVDFCRIGINFTFDMFMLLGTKKNSLKI